jgi:hypothetical protein
VLVGWVWRPPARPRACKNTHDSMPSNAGRFGGANSGDENQSALNTPKRRLAAAFDRPEHLHGLHGSFDVVNAENLRAAVHACGDAGLGSRIAFQGRDAEHIADDGLA